MNVNISIIDQQLQKVLNEVEEPVRDELGISDFEKLKSLSFVYLCVKTMLDLDVETAIDCLTEGGGDFGIDAIHITEEIDGEFVVTIFQGKYKRDLKGDANFPENAIGSMINAIRYIFDPYTKLGAINDRLKAKVESARSMIRDGFIPRVRAIACNNGIKWNDSAEQAIHNAQFGDQVTWEHVNHDVLISILQNVKPVNDTLRLSGKAIVEDMNYSRVCIGRIPVSEVANLLKTHGERLFERNIRRHLGLHGNRVNEGIRDTLTSDNPSNFYFFNNGLTLVCSDFSYNALQSSDYSVSVENLQIVNGGQTCMTIFKTLENLKAQDKPLPIDASVLLRLYKLPKDNDDIVSQITHATNSQNPVDLKDLRSNDTIQSALESSIQGLGFSYRRKRLDSAVRQTDITSGTAAEAVLAVWRRKPHQAKFLTREHFGKLYHTIFTNELNGAQTVAAVLLYRIAENHRKRPSESDKPFVRYASCFIAMQMGRRLMSIMNIDHGQLDHRNFNQAKATIEDKGEALFENSRDDVDAALRDLYSDEETSLQQLSATFRRGDLIEKLTATNI